MKLNFCVRKKKTVIVNLRTPSESRKGIGQNVVLYPESCKCKTKPKQGKEIQNLDLKINKLTQGQNKT
jgi:hypothetical protein